jgi:hypothetical protein
MVAANQGDYTMTMLAIQNAFRQPSIQNNIRTALIFGAGVTLATIWNRVFTDSLDSPANGGSMLGSWIGGSTHCQREVDRLQQENSKLSSEIEALNFRFMSSKNETIHLYDKYRADLKNCIDSKVTDLENQLKRSKDQMTNEVRASENKVGNIKATDAAHKANYDNCAASLKICQDDLQNERYKGFFKRTFCWVN